jgi:hypothetical protein
MTDHDPHDQPGPGQRLREQEQSQSDQHETPSRDESQHEAWRASVDDIEHRDQPSASPDRPGAAPIGATPRAPVDDGNMASSPAHQAEENERRAEEEGRELPG